MKRLGECDGKEEGGHIMLSVQDVIGVTCNAGGGDAGVKSPNREPLSSPECTRVGHAGAPTDRGRT